MFDARPGNVAFVMAKVAQGQVFNIYCFAGAWLP
jgi:hypothetical protein